VFFVCSNYGKNKLGDLNTALQWGRFCSGQDKPKHQERRPFERNMRCSRYTDDSEQTKWKMDDHDILVIPVVIE